MAEWMVLGPEWHRRAQQDEEDKLQEQDEEDKLQVPERDRQERPLEEEGEEDRLLELERGRQGQLGAVVEEEDKMQVPGRNRLSVQQMTDLGSRWDSRRASAAVRPASRRLAEVWRNCKLVGCKTTPDSDKFGPAPSTIESVFRKSAAKRIQSVS